MITCNKCGIKTSDHHKTSPYCKPCAKINNKKYWDSPKAIERRARIKAQIEARKLELKTQY